MKLHIMQFYPVFSNAFFLIQSLSSALCFETAAVRDFSFLFLKAKNQVPHKYKPTDKIAFFVYVDLYVSILEA